MQLSIPVRLLAVAALATLAACGGGSSATSSAASAAPAAAATTEASREMAALPMGAAVAVPAGLKCGAVKPVWVNLNTKSYHTSDDPYYGKTKNGKYECPAQAVTDGYHAAGSSHMHMGGKHHGHMHRGAAGSDDDASPAPAAT